MGYLPSSLLFISVEYSFYLLILNWKVIDGGYITDRPDSLERGYEFQEGSGFLKAGTDDSLVESVYVHMADRDKEGKGDVGIHGNAGGGDEVFTCWQSAIFFFDEDGVSALVYQHSLA
jgi:hypothetical protein